MKTSVEGIGATVLKGPRENTDMYYADFQVTLNEEVTHYSGDYFCIDCVYLVPATCLLVSSHNNMLTIILCTH